MKKPYEDAKTLLGKLTYFEYWNDVVLSWHWWIEDFFGESYGVSRGLILLWIYVGLLSVLWIEIPNLPTFALLWLIGTMPIWAPIAACYTMLKCYGYYAQRLWIAQKKSVLLELKVPRDVFKSPRAMEAAISNLETTKGETTDYDRYWKGQVRPWFSLEYFATAGRVHMYVWCWDSFRSTVEDVIYAAYPECELIEVEDYASRFRFDPKKHMGFAGDYIYWGKKYHDEYPIKSYVDFELDKDPKEDYRVDPIEQMFETLSGAQSHEQIWIQLTFRTAGRNNWIAYFNPQNTKTDYLKRCKKAIADLRLQAAEHPINPDYDPKEDPKDAQYTGRGHYGDPRPTWLQGEQIRTIERHMSKHTFEVGMRELYIADTTQGPMRGALFDQVRYIFKPYNNPNTMNFIRSRRGHNPFDYAWQDLWGIRWNIVTGRYVDAMRQRSFFHRPWETPSVCMSAELLATFWHPPASSVKAAGIQRIASTKGSPPPNLPR